MSDVICSICLSHLTQESSLSNIFHNTVEQLTNYRNLKRPIGTDCGHLFHRTCIQRWINQGNGSCPICRRSISADQFDEDLQLDAADDVGSNLLMVTPRKILRAVRRIRTTRTIATGPPQVDEISDEEEYVEDEENEIDVEINVEGLLRRTFTISRNAYYAVTSDFTLREIEIEGRVIWLPHEEDECMCESDDEENIDEENSQSVEGEECTDIVCEILTEIIENVTS